MVNTKNSYMKQLCGHHRNATLRLADKTYLFGYATLTMHLPPYTKTKLMNLMTTEICPEMHVNEIHLPHNRHHSVLINETAIFVVKLPAEVSIMSRCESEAISGYSR